MKTRTFTTYTRKVMMSLLGCAAWLTAQLGALEVSDLTYPLNRNDADKTLSKDYTYAMLADGSIRRTWDSADKTIIVDFDSTTNDAILMAVIYKKPVDKKVGIGDAHTLGRGKLPEKSAWDDPKDKASKDIIANTFGLKNAKRKKLTDSAMIFYEQNDKGTKITRVSLFTALPRNNRWELPVITTTTPASAMGNNWDKSYVESVYQDEARRQSSTAATDPTPAADAPARVENERTAMGRRAGGRKPGTAPNKRPKPSADTTVTTQMPTQMPPRRSTPAAQEQQPDTTQPTTSTITIGENRESKSETISTLPPAPAFLKQFGVEDPQWWHYIALGALGLLLLIIIFNAISKARRRAVQQQNFARIIGGGRPRR